MPYPIEEPHVEVSEGFSHREETKTTHPSFAQISVSRCSGGNTALYGSDFIHHNYVMLTISESELHRNLSNDWHFPRRQIIEVALSEAQWATLVSSFGQGSGVPCTLQWLQGIGPIPRLPSPKSRSDQFSAEMKKDMEDTFKHLDELSEEIKANTTGLSKKKQDALLSKVRGIYTKLTSSLPFVADQFSEHMETEVERAKVEIHGYATNLFQRAGIDALALAAPVTLELEDKTRG